MPATTTITKDDKPPSAGSLDHIRARYGVPARIGAPVRYAGKPGKVTGVTGAHVMIRLNGEDVSRPYHPTWNLTWDEEHGPATRVPTVLAMPAPTWPSIAGPTEPQWSGV